MFLQFRVLPRFLLLHVFLRATTGTTATGTTATGTAAGTTTGGGGTRGVSVAYSVLADSQAAADKGEAALSTVASGGESAMLALLGELKANTPGGGFAGETQLKLFYTS
jgi:hypothetical protein